MTYKNLIIDGPYLAYRSMSVPFHLKTTKNVDSTCIHLFFKSFFALLKHYNPEKTIVTWESHGTPSWRRTMCNTYKPTKPLNNFYIQQQRAIQKLLYYMDIPQAYAPCNEADDVIATLINSNEDNHPTLIFTVDKDIMQLVNEYTHVLSKKDIFTSKDVYDKFGVYPYQIPDYLALLGDKADNIEGVHGIGKVKAKNLLMKYEYLEYIPYTEFSNGEDDFKKAMFNKKLTTLNYEANIKEVFPTGHKQDINFKEIFEKYEIHQIADNIRRYKNELQQM